MSFYQDILHDIAQGAIVITPNNRLARELLTQFSKLQQRPCLEKPRVLSYPEFLRYLFIETQLQHPTHTHPVLLSPIHLRVLWRQTLALFEHPLCTEGLLQALINAWSLCHTWKVNLQEEAFQQLPQHQQFTHWVQHVEQQLQTLNAISEYHLPYYVDSFIANLALPDTLVC